MEYACIMKTYVHILLILQYDYGNDGKFILNIFHCFVKIMFVLAEPRLIIYISVVGTKSKQLSDA